MTQINLLPWREKKREQEKKKFISLLGISGIFVSLIMLLVNLYAVSLLTNQSVRNQLLQQEINQYDKKIQEMKRLELLRKQLTSKVVLVQNLQSTRPLMVHLFDELIKIIPSGIYFRCIEGKNNLITVLGYAESNNYVSQLMKNIENNEFIHKVTLNQIKKMEEKQHTADNEFQLSFVLDSPRLAGVKNELK